ncbi:MAG TPA: AAA family ATPase, partial [Stenomitos sp.]
MALRTLIIGTDPQREALRQALGQPLPATIAGEAASPADGVGLAVSLRPELVVLAYGGDLETVLRTVDGIQAANPLAITLLVGASLEAEALGKAMQAGIREVLASPSDLPAAIERAHVFLTRLKGARSASEPARTKSGKVIVVHSPKGGAGKSTLAVNLAVLFAKEGGAALIDLAPQFGEVDLLLNVKPQAYLSDIAKLGGKPDPEAIEQALCTHASGLRVLASTPTPEDGELIDRAVTATVLKDLKGRHAFTVVDTAPILSEPIVQAMELADRILLPFFPDLASLRHVQQSLKLWLDLGIDLSKVELISWSQKSEVDGEAMARVLHRSLAAQL